MKRTLSALAMILAVAAPAFAADDAMSISKQINDSWLAAANKGDAAALTALYTNDAVLMPHGVAQPIKGEANIRKFFDELVKAPLENTAIPITESKMLDPNTVLTAGPWSGDVPASANNPKIHLEGTYLGIAVRQGSDWKITADTWNQMPPPAAQPTTAAASAPSSGSTAPKQ